MIMDIINQPFTLLSEFLSSYGWLVVGVSAGALLLWSRLRPVLEDWRLRREDAAYHKDPDVVLARMEAVRVAREQQQAALQEQSARAEEARKEREEKKRAENLQRLQKYGASSGRTLRGDSEFLPLSGEARGSSYKRPRRSACGGGGCGR